MQVLLPSNAPSSAPSGISSMALPPDAIDGAVVAVFAVVYVGMFLGGLPRLKLDRAGVALLGAIAMIAITGMSLEQAARAVDLPTIVLLFAFMVVSAQMRLGGFYTAVTQRVGALALPAPALLAVVLAVAAALAAVFSNDIVCLAMTPVVARICLQRRIDPLPFLLGLACAANIGSAATLIGNPQNMLIGSMLTLPFGHYLATAWLPVVASLVPMWLWLVLAGKPREPSRATGHAHSSDARGPATPVVDDEPPFDPVQSAKGLLVATALFVVFLFTGLPREVAALVGAGILLLSRRLHSAQVMGFVDWQLLLLFIGLFIVNHAFQATGLPTKSVTWLATQGVHLNEPGTLLVVGAADVEPGVERARGDAAGAAPERRRPRHRRAARIGQHLRRQPAAGGQHRQPHRRRPGREGRRHDRLEAPRPRGRAGDVDVAGGVVGLLGGAAPGGVTRRRANVAAAPQFTSRKISNCSGTVSNVPAPVGICISGLPSGANSQTLG